MGYQLIIAKNGKVNYLMKQKDGPVGSATPLSTAEWMLEQNKPFRSTEYPGFPVAVKTENGDEYFFEGTWDAPKRKRKKDAVCGNDYCELE